MQRVYIIIVLAYAKVLDFPQLAIVHVTNDGFPLSMDILQQY